MSKEHSMQENAVNTSWRTEKKSCPGCVCATPTHLSGYLVERHNAVFGCESLLSVSTGGGWTRLQVQEGTGRTQSAPKEACVGVRRYRSQSGKD